MNPKLLLNLLLIPISFNIPPFSPLRKGGCGKTKPFAPPLIRGVGGIRGWGGSNNQGFTLIDVIIGMLIASIFLLVSLQAMVVEAYFRIAAQSSSEGLLLIQQDLEEVKFYATESSLAYDSTKCSTYGAALKTNILNNMTAKDSNKDGIYTASVNANAITYQLTRTATVSTTDPKVLTLTYSVKRDKKGGTNYTTQVATLYTEVIPDAAFQCP